MYADALYTQSRIFSREEKKTGLHSFGICDISPPASALLPWKINSLQQNNSGFLPLHYLQFPTSVSPCKKYLHCKIPPRHGQ